MMCQVCVDLPMMLAALCAALPRLRPYITALYRRFYAYIR
jgi:hypothetical protein